MASPGDVTADDWQKLKDAARGMLDRAYAPYSHFPVGAAALVDDGRVVVLLAPCGRCRQLLAEFSAVGMRLAMPAGEMTIEEVLPGAFRL